MYFKELPLHPNLLTVLETKQFVNPTEIQQRAIPLLLASPSVNFHGQAQTGTGKTLAFGLPLLHRITPDVEYPQALVVAPTRELAIQIFDSLKPFAQSLGLSILPVYGGASMYEQTRSLKKGVQVIIGTPGRLNDHLRRKTLDVSRIQTLVLDEADIMLDMGFRDEIDEILQAVNPGREIWLFSATIKGGIAELISKHMPNTQTVKVAKKDNASDKPLVEQYYCSVPMRTRLQALCRILDKNPQFYGFIFCQTKMLTGEIAENLLRRGYTVGALHGDLSQGQRNSVIKQFKERNIQIVVATDVAARGIDIPHLSHVINFSIPEDHESYVHRIGRTGRAGNTGTAITFISRSETRIINSIARKFNFTITPMDVPSQAEIVTARMSMAHDYIADMLAKEDPMCDQVSAAVSHLTREDLQKLAQHLLYDRFIKLISEQQDSVDFEKTPSLSQATNELASQQEVSLLVGSDDGVTRQDITALLQQEHVDTAMVLKVRVIKRKTFITVPTESAQVVITALQKKQIAGRNLKPELVQENQSTGGTGSWQNKGSARRRPFSSEGKFGNNKFRSENKRFSGQKPGDRTRRSSISQMPEDTGSYFKYMKNNKQGK